MHRLMVTLVGALAVVLVGCGGDGLSSACDLLTTAEAEDVLGVPTRAGVEDDDDEGPGSTCEWISQDSSTEPEDAVYGFYVSEASDAAARERFEARRDEESDIGFVEPVPDLGDEAYRFVYTEPNSLSGTPSLPFLTARVGDRILGIGTFESDERPVTIEEAKRIEQRVAALAVAELTGSG